MEIPFKQKTTVKIAFTVMIQKGKYIFRFTILKWFHSGSTVMAVISTLLHFRLTNLTKNHRVSCFKTHAKWRANNYTQANARAHVWTFYGSVPFLRKHWSSTEELHFYGTATAYTTEELDFYGTSSRLFPQNSYFSEERSQIYKERLQNSKERCSILKITVVFLQNDTTFSSRSVVPCGPP